MSWEGTDLSPLQSELATSLRVPLLATSNPSWPYITGIVVGGIYCWSTEGFGGGVLPTDDEICMVGSFLEHYCDYWYRGNFLAEMREKAPYDLDDGANLAYLIKRPDGGWGYRKKTWRWDTSPHWWGQGEQPVSLLPVLDQIHTLWPDHISGSWLDWKAEHPNVFGTPP